ncbi:MAG: Glu/Leu/Phe/Val dehydrogenase, partial [Acidimicrobiales bacterium]
DTYANLTAPSDRQSVKRVVTGKTLECGGSQGRDKATGQGAVFALQHYCNEVGDQVVGSNVAVQGFGNVGGFAASILHDMGSHVTAVADHTGAVFAPEGLDVPALRMWAKGNGGVKGFNGGDEMRTDEFFSADVDFLIPAALENQITAENAHSIKARVILEAANGPTTPAAEKILLNNGTEVLPDILVNAGGVVVSYFEWVQNKTSLSWDLAEVDKRLKSIIWRASDQTSANRKRYGCTRREGAYATALDRLSSVYNQRGIFP